jgi:hypothetical protein
MEPCSPPDSAAPTPSPAPPSITGESANPINKPLWHFHRRRPPRPSQSTGNHHIDQATQAWTRLAAFDQSSPSVACLKSIARAKILILWHQWVVIHDHDTPAPSSERVERPFRPLPQVSLATSVVAQKTDGPVIAALKGYVNLLKKRPVQGKASLPTTRYHGGSVRLKAAALSLHPGAATVGLSACSTAGPVRGTGRGVPGPTCLPAHGRWSPPAISQAVALLLLVFVRM